MNNTEVQNPQLKLIYLLCGLCLFPNNSSSDSKAFLCFIAFSGSPTAVHRAFTFSLMQLIWPQSQTDLFMCTTVLHCRHIFLRHTDLIYGITLWVYLSEPLVKHSHKRLSSMENTQCVLKLMWSHIHVTYVLHRGIRKHCTWRKWLTYLYKQF